MKIPLVLVLLPVLAVTAFPVQLVAQPPSAPAAAAEGIVQAEVTEVKFAGARSPSGETWLEVNVEVSAKPGGRAVSGEFVDRVRVTLNLGIDLPGDASSKKRSYYRASGEAVTLEGGAKSVFRFYLPPEVVRRDKIVLGEAGKFYVVELEVDGKEQSIGRPSASSIFGLPLSASTRGFLGLVKSEGGKNLGVLIPQHLSPFDSDTQRRAPSMVRHESER